jgi:hypothetical protein
MKKTGFSLAISIFALLLVSIACNMSTANLGDLTTSTDKEGKSTTSSFKSGETVHGRVPVKNNPGKVKIKFALTAEDVKGMTKGETVKGSEVPVDLSGDGTATYELTIPAGAPGGSYRLTADMMNEAGEKKDSKTANINITQTAPPPAAKTDDDEDKDDN